MNLELIMDTERLPSMVIDKLLSDIQFKQKKDPDYEEYKLSIVSSCITRYLIKYTKFEFSINACGVSFPSCKYEFDMWLQSLPYNYISINEADAFDWDLREQNYKPIFQFTHQKNSYLLTLLESKTDNWEKEEINIDVLKKEIDTTRQIYYDYVQENLGDVLSDYLELLDLSFED